MSLLSLVRNYLPPLVFVVACAAAIAFSGTASVAQISPTGGGADSPPTAAQASSPSPETGRRLEPQLFGFILFGGGILCAIGARVTDRYVRSH